MTALDVDLGELDAETRKELFEHFQLRSMELAARNERVRIETGQSNQADRRSVEGLGGVNLSCTAFDYHRFRIMEGQSWQDEDFRAWFRKRHEYARVKSGGTKIMVGASGVAGCGVKRVFRKVY